MIETATFTCSICGEASHDICVYCTKDTCANHRCVRCRRCSDCCECEVPLTASEPEMAAGIPPAEPEPLPPTHPEPLPQPQPEPVPQPQPEPIGPTEPEPAPGTEPQPETPAPTMDLEPRPVIAVIEQATTHEELVAALPELFAPEPAAPPAPEPAPPEASEEPDLNTPRPEILKEAGEDDEEQGEAGTAPKPPGGGQEH